MSLEVSYYDKLSRLNSFDAKHFELEMVPGLGRDLKLKRPAYCRNSLLERHEDSLVFLSRLLGL